MLLHAGTCNDGVIKKMLLDMKSSWNDERALFCCFFSVFFCTCILFRVNNYSTCFKTSAKQRLTCSFRYVSFYIKKRQAQRKLKQGDVCLPIW